MSKDRIRVLLTKSRLDGHDRGMRYIARKLMEAGMEVVLTRYASPDDVARTALDEDVAVIGISFSVGRASVVTARVMELLKENGAGHIRVIIGGIIPDDDVAELLALGVSRMFGPGSRAEDVIQFITSHVG